LDHDRSREIQAFVDEHVRRIEPLARDEALASWEAATTGTEEANERQARLQAERMRVYANREEFERLRAWDQSPPDDPTLARQVRLLRLAYEQGQRDEEMIDRLANLEKDILSAYVNHRGIFEGQPLSDNELVGILTTETDSSKLRAAWEAGKSIGREVAPRILEAVELRNAAAGRAGYADYYRQSLDLSEIGFDRLLEILGELERLTDEPFTREKADLDRALAAHYGLAIGDLRPWHYHDPFFQRAPSVGTVDLDPLFASKDLQALAVRTYDGIGLDVRDVLDRSDLFPRAGKDQHAFCTHIDRRGDVRILCNLVSNERWMETLLHELGHGVYDKYLGADLPYVLREPAHTLSTEAIAMLFGRQALSPEWLVRVLGLSEAEVGPIGARALARQRLAMLVFVRWVLVMVHFERQLYADPEQDLNSLWWDLVERYQGLRRPEDRDEPDWAAKIHLALYPAYYQNYMLGELMASHLSHWLSRVAGGVVDRPEAGEALRTALFGQGARADWDTTLERATGERLNPGYFVADFVAREGAGKGGRPDMGDTSTASSGTPSEGAPAEPARRSDTDASADAAQRTSVEIVIPVYNEESDLERSVSTLRDYLHGLAPAWTWRITVADNASTDGTLAIAKELAARWPDEVGYVHLDQKGRGRALRRAWTESPADIVTYMDVDLSTDLSALPKLIDALQSGADVAIGSRLMRGSKVTRGLKREVISRIYNLIIQVSHGTGFRDAQCGFKGVTRRVVRELLPLAKDQAFFLDTELLLIAEGKGYRIAEIPVTWTDDPDSRVRIFRTAWEDLKGLWRLKTSFPGERVARPSGSRRALGLAAVSAALSLAATALIRRRRG
jgi:peptidyl-dipeptidase A